MAATMLHSSALLPSTATDSAASPVAAATKEMRLAGGGAIRPKSGAQLGEMVGKSVSLLKLASGSSSKFRGSGLVVEAAATVSSSREAKVSLVRIGTRGRVAGSQQEEDGELDDSVAGVSSRRAFLGGLIAGIWIVQNGVVEGASAAIPTYRKYVDRLDGYTFAYPAGWIEVRGAGADVFFRDPVNLDENLLVEISSPSSSKFKGVEDLGTPEQAAKKVLQQYLTEFMSTRIGVRREANVASTKSRVGEDGRLYYEVEVVASSYANNNQLAVMPENRVAKLEWSRRYLSVLGVENNRLYQLRLQVPENVAELEEKDLRRIMSSFGVLKLEA